MAASQNLEFPEQKKTLASHPEHYFHICLGFLFLNSPDYVTQICTHIANATHQSIYSTKFQAKTTKYVRYDNLYKFLINSILLAKLVGL